MARAPQTTRPWSVPVGLDEVPDTGRHFDLVADERARATIAELARLQTLPRLQATIEVTRHGRDGLRVTGLVSATVGQVCGVTLEPMENEVEEPVDLVFIPQVDRAFDAEDADGAVAVTTEDAPEPLVNGVVDLGAIATEFLILGIDPYPRKPDAVFEAPAATGDAPHPFAALAALKKGQAGQ